MPKFVGKRTVVEAVQFNGYVATWPEQFRLAVGRHLPGGTTEIKTAEGVLPVRHNDWVIRGPYGDFSVMRPAAFETYFEEHHQVQPTRKKELIGG